MITQLQSPVRAQVQHVDRESQEKNINLNKRSRVRISPQDLPLQTDGASNTRGSFFAVANSKGWFAAVVKQTSGQFALAISSLASLRKNFEGNDPSGEVVLSSERTLPLHACPSAIAFASNDARLVLGLEQGSILVYDTAALFRPGYDEINSIGTFQPSAPTPPIQILGNPGDVPDLVAILRAPTETPSGQNVEIIDVIKFESVSGWASGSAPDTIPTSISWSPKGKQLAIGMKSGDILTFSPASPSELKLLVPAPPNSQGKALIGLTWLSSPTFHAVYSRADGGGFNDQTHHILTSDAKSSVLTSVKLDPPTGLGPSSFSAVLRNWEPTRFLILIGDSLSSEIGVIGNAAEEWNKLSLEEDSSTPILPLNRHTEDTVLVGLEVDLSGTESLRTTVGGEDVELVAPPIVYGFVSDGTVQAWYIVNPAGGFYPGMVAAPATLGSTPAFGQSAIGSSPFAGGSSGPAFGQPAFGQPSAFGQQPSAFGTAAPTGFGAFADAAPSKFGQPSFGFGNSLAPPPVQTAPSSSPVEMAMDAPGSISQSVSQGSAMGQDSPSTESGEAGREQSASASASTAFGTSGFAGATPVAGSMFGGGSGFGQSGFGQSGFGQSGFGQVSAFGQSAFGAKPAGAAAGAFSSFASGGTSSFASLAGNTGGGRQAKPAWANGGGGFGTPEPVFGEKSPATSVFAGGGASSASNSVFATPSLPSETRKVPGLASPSSSPEPSDEQALPADEDSATARISIKPSVFGASSSSPSPFGTATTGAFANLKTSTSGFLKPESGQGFGGSAISASSPFFKAPASTPPVTAFSGLGNASTGGSSSPVFGATSALGGARSVFSKPEAQPASSATHASAFSSFGGEPSRFGVSDAPRKSFGDLLKGDAKETPKIEVSVFGAPPPPLKPVPKEEPERGEAQEKKEDDGKRALSESFSMGSLSQSISSDASSFVDVRGDEFEARDEADANDDGEDILSPSGSEGEESEEGELSSEAGDGDEESSEEEEKDEEDEEDEEVEEGEEGEAGEAEGGEDPEKLSENEEPSTPKAPSRSPSTTPGANGNKSAEKKQEAESKTSTTPPGSPTAEPAPVKEVHAPTAVTPGLAPTFGGLGLGRPSTRPTKSSPLAGGSAFSVHRDEAEPPSGPSQLPTPKPASPKPSFGSWAPAAKAAPSGSVESQPRPKTPPLLFAAGSAKPPSFGLGGAATNSPSTTPSSPAPSLLAGLPPKPAAPGQLNSTPPPKLAHPGAGFASGSLPSTPSPPVFSIPKSAPSLGTSNPQTVRPPFSLTQRKPAASGSALVQGTTSGVHPQAPLTPIPRTAPTEPTPEQGMQAECAYMFESLTKELADLQIMAQQANRKREELSKSLGGSRRLADLPDQSKWGLSDLALFSQTLKQFEVDIRQLTKEREAFRLSIRELECGTLKVGTRKEEIARFNKAKTDEAFSKMLKTRTLGPEHLETQSQLRRDIRAMHDRVQKLEDRLAVDKRRLYEFKSGKPALKAPSLDTINRVYRNIDLAIVQQSDEIGQLAKRLSKLKANGVSDLSSPSRDGRLPDRKRRFDSTPNVAVTTAAALNAERSAQRLKRALVKVRQQPLLNTTAITATPPPSSFLTPLKLQTNSQSFDLSGTNLQLFPEPKLPNWNPTPSPDDSPLAGLSSRRVERGGNPKHAKPVQFKKPVNSTASPPAAPAFNWGPLPTTMPTRKGLPVEIRGKSPAPLSSPSPAPTGSPQSSLSSPFVPLGKK